MTTETRAALLAELRAAASAIGPHDETLAVTVADMLAPVNRPYISRLLLAAADALAAPEAPAGPSGGTQALDVDALVAAIQDELFTSGSGDPAIRLQMRGYGERDLGGWNKFAVAARVRAALAKAQPPSSLAAPEDAGTVPPKRHGVDCPKVKHIGGGYLHAEDDDTPYNVDGVRYCGRCHSWMEQP